MGLCQHAAVHVANPAMGTAYIQLPIIFLLPDLSDHAGAIQLPT